MRYIIGAAMALCLAACGGGSATDTVSTYTGDERAAFDLLNAKREQCGFGALMQNAQLDQSTAAHVRYITANQALVHYETAGMPGFTGTSPVARAAAAGYVGSVGEDAAAILWAPSMLPRGATLMEELLDVPYHAAVALEPMRDVGMAYGGGAFVADFGLASGQPKQSVTGVRTYPCDGTSGVLASVTGEEPSPVSAAVWGPSISVVGHQVRIESARITDQSGADVPILDVLGDGATRDPNGFCAGANACVIPTPLQPGQTYSAHINGTDSGAAFSVSFSFSTAP